MLLFWKYNLIFGLQFQTVGSGEFSELAMSMQWVIRHHNSQTLLSQIPLLPKAMASAPPPQPVAWAMRHTIMAIHKTHSI